MRRNTNQRTEGWRLEPLPGLGAMAIDEDGWARAVLRLRYDPDPTSAAMFEIMRVDQYHQRLHREGDPIEEQPVTAAFPVEWALRAVNDKKMVALIVALSGPASRRTPEDAVADDAGQLGPAVTVR